MRIETPCFPWSDPKQLRVKLINGVKKTASSTIRCTWLRRIRIKNRLRIPPFGGNLTRPIPALFQKLGIAVQNKQLVVPVTHVIPSSVMGSGIGSKHSFSGDYDIQVADREVVQKYGLQNLRLGDLIAIRDADCRYGRAFHSGAISVGIVVHGSCITSGHGPGVTIIMTTLEKLIVPKIEPSANIADYLNISRKKTGPKSKRRRRR